MRDGVTTCNGYMKLFQALANRTGLQSKEIIGTVGNEYHGWNMVSIDGVWRQVDLTWYDVYKDDCYLCLDETEIQGRNVLNIID